MIAGQPARPGIHHQGSAGLRHEWPVGVPHDHHIGLQLCKTLHVRIRVDVLGQRLPGAAMHEVKTPASQHEFPLRRTTAEKLEVHRRQQGGEGVPSPLPEAQRERVGFGVLDQVAPDEGAEQGDALEIVTFVGGG